MQNKIYLVEKGDDVDFNSLGQNRLDAAIMQTQIVDDLFLRYTSGMEETLRFLMSLHASISRRYANSDLFAGIMAHPVQRQSYLAYLAEQGRNTGHQFHQSYGCYTQLNHKSANLTVSDIFLKQLLCIRQLTADKAVAIIGKFPTLLSLYRFYGSLGSARDREHYFKDWTVGDSHRRFGLALSKRIYHLIHGESYPVQ